MSGTSFIHGFHAITARLRLDAKSVHELYCDAARADPRMRDLVKLAEGLALRVLQVDARRLDMAYNLDTPVPTQAQAEQRSLTYTGQERAHIQSQRARLVHGSAATCREKLLAIAEQFSADELMVLTITGDYASRRHSYELLIDAF